MDADGQHNPEDIERLIESMPGFDMVVGARSISDQATLGLAVGNKAFNWFASYVAKFSIKDLTSGFREVKTHVARNFLYLLPNTYSYPTTLTLGVLRSGMSLDTFLLELERERTARATFDCSVMVYDFL